MLRRTRSTLYRRAMQWRMVSASAHMVAVVSVCTCVPRWRDDRRLGKIDFGSRVTNESASVCSYGVRFCVFPLHCTTVLTVSVVPFCRLETSNRLASRVCHHYCSLLPSVSRSMSYSQRTPTDGLEASRPIPGHGPITNSSEGCSRRTNHLQHIEN
jgi:hypothetical protein